MRKPNDEQKIRDAALYLHGRLERELEAYAASISVPPVELIARVGGLLSGSGQWTGNSVPHLPTGGDSLGTRKTRARAPKVEGAGESHGSRPSTGRRKRQPARNTAKTAKGKVKSGAGSWAKFKTKAARRKESARRRALWPDEAKQKWNNPGPRKRRMPTPEELGRRRETAVKKALDGAA